MYSGGDGDPRHDSRDAQPPQAPQPTDFPGMASRPWEVAEGNLPGPNHAAGHPEFQQHTFQQPVPLDSHLLRLWAVKLLYISAQMYPHSRFMWPMTANDTLSGLPLSSKFSHGKLSPLQVFQHCITT